MRFETVMRVRVPGDLKGRLDGAASRSARSHSDIIREAVSIGLVTPVLVWAIPNKKVASV